MRPKPRSSIPCDPLPSSTSPPPQPAPRHAAPLRSTR
jgi:hypothetical protein